MKTYLITGGAGFIGSNFIHYLLKKYEDIKVINLDKLTYAGNLKNLDSVCKDERYRFICGDISSRETVRGIFADWGIDYVVNFAAESHVDRSIRNPELFVETNVLGTSVLLNAAREFWERDELYTGGKKFLQVSTDEVYGSLGKEGLFTEVTTLQPHSPYSSSKAAADLIVKAYYDTYGMPVCITRCSNNYGPYQFPEKLIPLVIHNALKHEPLPVYGDGQNVRDWLYVEDHCAAIDLVINKGRAGEVYNIGGNNERTNIRLVKTILDYLNKQADSSITYDLIRYIKDRKGHDRRYAIDSAKIRTELGWKPAICFEEGIIKTVDWYLQNKDWLEDVTSGEYLKYYNSIYGGGV